MRYLSEMLPYDPKSKKAKEGLMEFKLLLVSLRASLLAFQKGRLEKFDSLVGENACQIRAFWVMLIAERQEPDFEALMYRLDVAEAEISHFSGEGSLQEFLTSRGIDILIPTDVWHLTQLYILTHIKVQTGSSFASKETTDPKRLQLLGNITVSSARRLISKCRKEIAKMSVEIIKEYAECSNIDAVVVNHNECWPCIPMFLTYQAILASGQKKGIPVIIHVKFLGENDSFEESYLYYKPIKGQYTLITPTETDLDKPTILIEGLTMLRSFKTWKEKFETFPLATIILAGAADHRQYPDPSHEHLVEVFADSEFYKLKALAQKQGFSIDNPSMFLIKHVYPTKGKNIEALRAA